ncbi:hypothetical protein BDC45DRAFT_575418 [Circinella umbellata]|nr:hypothetical protein BDC45DRAFT_575418 [Circinella umbellata]
MYQNDCTSTTSFKSHNNSDNYEYCVYDESAGNENNDDDDEDDIDEEQSFNADKGRNCEDIDEEQEFKDFSKEKSIVSRCKSIKTKQVQKIIHYDKRDSG